MKTLLILLTLCLSSPIFAGAKMTVHLEENQATKQVVFQCENLNECVERMQQRIEDKGGCDSRVKKVELERVYIPGLDDA